MGIDIILHDGEEGKPVLVRPGPQALQVRVLELLLCGGMEDELFEEVRRKDPRSL